MTTCEAKGCSREHYAKSFCKAHYTQVMRHGRLTPERERGAVRPCGAKGCARLASVNAHCRKHARQIRTHGRLTPELERERHEGCRVARCKHPHRAKGLCAVHYNAARWQRIKAAKPVAKKPARAAS
jgi:hypothetical protein